MTNEHDTPFHFLEKWNNTDFTIIIRRHAFEMMYSRNVSEEEIEMVIRTGEIIEYYPDDHPFPSALLYGDFEDRLLHVVAAFNQIGKEIIIITAYEPDEDHFESRKIRRKQ